MIRESKLLLKIFVNPLYLMKKSNTFIQDFHSFGIIRDPDGYFEQTDFVFGTGLQIQLRIEYDIILEIYFHSTGSMKQEIQLSLENLAGLIKNKSIQEILQNDFDLKLNEASSGKPDFLVKGFAGIRQAIGDYQKRTLSTSGIDVAGGLIWKGDHLLIAKRSLDDALGGLWEFPGGKRESNETLASALVREIKEELDISIRVKDLYARLESDGNHKKITLFILNCDYLDGTPQAVECADWKWITRSQLAQFEFTPLDQRLIPEIANFKQK